jgi:hypothetical protein
MCASTFTQDFPEIRKEYEELDESDHKQQLERDRHMLRGPTAEAEQEQALRGNQRREDEGARDDHRRQVRGNSMEPRDRIPVSGNDQRE